jgi:anti-sigma regulatory factor (Ser/Thr protein kinase)
MPATDRSQNGGAPRSRVSHSGPGGTATARAAPDHERDAAIEGLALAVARLRRGAAALKAENQQLRGEIAGLQPAAPSRRSSDAAIPQFGKLAEIALPTGSGAPGAARMVIAHCLTGLVSQRVLPDAELLVSELVTNSVRHGELGDGDTVLVRVYLAAETLRLEVENPGTAGVVASSPPGPWSREGGLGLYLVDLLAARWGVNRTGSTNVWFEMGRA